MRGTAAKLRTIVLCGGHESGGGAGLRWLDGSELEGSRVEVAAPGRELEAALGEALRAGGAATVLPMTLGRDPRLVSDAARTVRWATREGGRQVALARPFGTADHLVGWLRSACRLPDPGLAVVIAAPASNPFDDAELYRVAALVRTNSGERMVEVGLRSPSGGIEEALARCRLLGADEVAVVPAELRQRADAAAPLLSPAMVQRIVAARAAAAAHLLEAHRDDGVAAALASDHEHGFAHSHGDAGHTHQTHGDRLTVG